MPIGDEDERSMFGLDWGAASETGRVRRNNEDSFVAQLPVFAIADGMGGHAAGDVASAMVIDELRRLAVQGPRSVGDISNAIAAANSAVVSRSRTTGSMRGMGTTLVGMVLIAAEDTGEWVGFNVGDSRLYRFSDGALEQVSRDHSEVQELLDAGSITREEARTSSVRNVVTRGLGAEMQPQVDYWLIRPVPGDRFLMCSDGLTDELVDQEIATVLIEATGAAAVAHQLVERALAAGGHDNVSVIVLDVLSAARCDPNDDTAPRAGMTAARTKSIPPRVSLAEAVKGDRSESLVEEVPAVVVPSERVHREVISAVPTSGSDG
ncbi:MAG: PP2C family protein-serine/threonine phosphatase [Acidimicrobiales bacterium]